MRREGSQYEVIVQINERVILLIDRFHIGQNQELLKEVHKLLHPVTMQTIIRTLRALCLPYSEVDDMLQDAFLKLLEAVGNFRKTRTPSFISFWRVSLYRHLLSNYYCGLRPVQLPEDLQGVQNHTTDKMLVKELLERYLMEFRNDRCLCEILRRRIFDEYPIKQSDLADELRVTQGYISRCETWLRDKIRADYPHLVQENSDGGLASGTGRQNC